MKRTLIPALLLALAMPVLAQTNSSNSAPAGMNGDNAQSSAAAGEKKPAKEHKKMAHKKHEMKKGQKKGKAKSEEQAAPSDSTSK